jgi:hypothetical protein
VAFSHVFNKNHVLRRPRKEKNENLQIASDSVLWIDGIPLEREQLYMYYVAAGQITMHVIRTLFFFKICTLIEFSKYLT